MNEKLNKKKKGEREYKVRIEKNSKWWKEIDQMINIFSKVNLWKYQTESQSSSEKLKEKVRHAYYMKEAIWW